MPFGEYIKGYCRYICSFVTIYRLCLRCVPGSWLGTGDVHVTISLPISKELSISNPSATAD